MLKIHEETACKTSTVVPDNEDLLIAAFPFVRRCLAAARKAKLELEGAAQNYLNTAITFLEMMDHLALFFAG